MDTPVRQITNLGDIANQAVNQTISGNLVIQGQSKDDSPLHNLPYATQAAFNSLDKRHDSLCLPNTRVDVLEQIRAWADGRDERCIFWLNGMAGTGKSTVARTIAREYHAQNKLGASFFFSRGEKELSNVNKFFATVAVQLAQKSPALRSRICEAAAKNGDIATRVLSEQWELLVLRPLITTEANSLQLPLLLVIDALDECEDERDVKEILRLLAAADALSAIRLRVLMTSRPEIPIRLGFHKMAGILRRDLVLHNVPREIIDHDITIYFHNELKNIELNEQTIRRLTEKASGLFIWAATACRFINMGKRFANTRLALIIEGSNHKRNPEEELDNIYVSVLLNSISGEYDEEEKVELFELFRKIVGAIVILFDPLSADALARLLNNAKPAVDQTLGDLHSVLKIPENPTHPIRLLHPSFRDFLLDKQRCQDQQFWVEEKEAHQMLAINCLRLMSEHLKRNICGLHSPGVLAIEVHGDQITKCLPKELQYACRYWVEHLRQSEAHLGNNAQVHQFLQKHFLHWLEALALMGKISDGAVMLGVLESTLTHNHNINSLLRAIIHNAKPFILRFGSMMEKAPLQIYCAALIFRSSESNIIRQFWDQRHPYIKSAVYVGKARNLSALQTLKGHLDWVSSVAFSPDGKLVASGSRDKTVRFWDAATGAPRGGPLEGHSDWVRSVAFSPDGKLVASGSWDKTVKLWDAATRVPHGRPLEGHSSWVRSVAFSPDGKLVASGSRDETVRLWDATTGAPRGRPLEGHLDWVSSVAFSPDGELVASGSRDETVRLWDAATGAPHGRPLKSHSSLIQSVAFSPDGKLVASGSGDETVRLWDAATGAPRGGPLEGHRGSIQSVAFSPDGKLVASGSRDKTVRLWDAATGAPRGEPLEGHWSSIQSVAFSPDGKLIAPSVVNHWVTKNTEKVISLLPDDQATCVAVWEGLLVLGHSSGAVSFFEFN